MWCFLHREKQKTANPRNTMSSSSSSSMSFKNLSFFLFSLLILTTSHSFPLNTTTTFPNPQETTPSGTGGGEWVLLHDSIGVSAMHMQLMYDNKVVIFDRTDFGLSNLSLPSGKCRYNDAVLKLDCSAHSLLYDVASNTFRPLMVLTNIWCSSASVRPDGTLVQTGGYLAGDKKIRVFTPCSTTTDAAAEQCDWFELPQQLLVRRWYSSNHILPDGRFIIVGGRRQFNYEFFPKNSINGSLPELFNLPFLQNTTDPFEENNLYPFLHLLPDGNLFIFANRRSISFDYVNNRVVKEFPEIPGEKRNYPSTGSSVLLPLRGNSPAPEVMICGGAPAFAFYQAEELSVYVAASKTCGRLKVTDPEPQWLIENMPMSRVMSDMILLPSGDVLIINGASNGTAGWEDAVGPVLNPVLYSPTQPDSSKRFTVLSPTTIPRMYHSAAILLPDGRILVGGSNPHLQYNFTAMPYPTELSLEAFLPPYMAKEYSNLRPSILTVEARDKVVSYGQGFAITFMVASYGLYQDFKVAVIAPPFATHSFGMSQRLIYLDIVGGAQKLSMFGYKVSVVAPVTKNIAPPGHYMLFVVHNGIPGECVWIQINN